MKTLDPNTDTGDLLQPRPRALPANPLGAGKLFLAYNGYRLLVASCLLALLVIPGTHELVRGFDRTLFVAGCSLLIATAIFLIGPLGKIVRRGETGVFGLMLTDILAVAIIVSSSGGILSGLSVLYLITVAAAAIMLSTRILATLIAAIAALAVLADTVWMVSRGEADFGMLLPSGVLGSLLFAVSLLFQLMASRLAMAEAQADAAESQVQALQQLNQQVILHMQTGILLVNSRGLVTAINAAAQRLLSLEPGQSSEINLVSPDLAHQYILWSEGNRHRPEPFRIQTDGPAMVASFAALDETGAADNLIFVEDYTPVTQFAQSLKLNSLSKLTASIAHEIRNPLASISHAAQLLSESDTIDKADQILCDILVSNSQRVSDIIDNVTEVTRRQAPKPELIALEKWLPEFRDEYLSLRTTPGEVELEVREQGLRCSIDPQHLKRILTNLIDNGLRHSRDDSDRSEVRVEVSSDPNSQSVHIDVIDYGLGVAENNIGRLFEPFFTTSREGSGLGLYLCKELCEINGAGLIYQPTPAGESAFRVTVSLEAF